VCREALPKADLLNEYTSSVMRLGKCVAGMVSGRLCRSNLTLLSACHWGPVKPSTHLLVLTPRGAKMPQGITKQMPWMD
jgi:hypothetical protein